MLAALVHFRAERSSVSNYALNMARISRGKLRPPAVQI
jgi:hypothetical protein